MSGQAGHGDTDRKPAGLFICLAVTLTGLLVHGILWAFIVLEFVFMVPRHERVFADYQMKLPWQTEGVFALARVWWRLLPMAALVSLCDGALLFWLTRQRRWVLLLLWAVALTAFLFVVLTQIEYAVHLARAKLQEGLAR